MLPYMCPHTTIYCGCKHAEPAGAAAVLRICYILVMCVCVYCSYRHAEPAGAAPLLRLYYILVIELLQYDGAMLTEASYYIFVLILLHVSSYYYAHTTTCVGIRLQAC
jgi:hypothetical protein